MDQALQDKLMQYLDAIERGVVDIAPKAYQMAVEVNYLAALINAIIFGVVLIVGWWFVAFCLSFPMKAAKKAKANDEYMDYEEYIPAYMAAGITGFFCFIGSIVYLSATSMWITLVNKDLGLVYMIWQKFVG